METLIVPTDSGKVTLLPIPITTSRLILRRLSYADLADLNELDLDKELVPYNDTFCLPSYSEADDVREEQLSKWVEADQKMKPLQDDNTLWLGIEKQDPSKLIGYLTIRFTDSDHQQVEFGIVLNRDFRRKGFGTEAVVGILRFCFKGISVHRVSASCDSQNVPARRMLEKAGMRCEGEFIQARRVLNEWVSIAWYAMLEEEHKAE